MESLELKTDAHIEFLKKAIPAAARSLNIADPKQRAMAIAAADLMDQIDEFPTPEATAE